MAIDEREAGTHSGCTATERLRDRTDEIELIISSLTIYALFSVPGWVFGEFADVYTHLSTGLVIAGTLASTLLAGFCYGLATCFVVHLMARAYWVGLIGLRTAFPDGIRWDRTRLLGPIDRDHYRNSLPDLDTIIQSADRLASSLFAVISILTIAVLWFGTIMTVTLVVAVSIGAKFGLTNTALIVASIVLFAALCGIPILSYLLDAQLAARVARLRGSKTYAALVSGLRRISGLAYPRRLVLPALLILQSNTRPLAFFFALTLGTVACVAVGNLRFAAWQNFTLSSAFTHLDSEQVRNGFQTTYYEDMPSSRDRLRAWPRVDSFLQSGSFVRLFLPYQPLRDNLVLDELCDDLDKEGEPAACLRQLWSVRIAGAEIPMDRFHSAERADLGMRGLIGILPLAGLKPGIQEIEVRWSPAFFEKVLEIDDRYEGMTTRFVIPIAFAPDYELPLD